MTDAFPYAPQTDRGTGVALPIAKALGHIFSVFDALTRDWPLTLAEGALELTEASNHLEDVQTPTGLLSDNFLTHLTLIGAANNAIRAKLSGPEGTAMKDVVTKEEIQHLVQSCWVFLTMLDHELTGLTSVQNDPGRLP